MQKVLDESGLPATAEKNLNVRDCRQDNLRWRDVASFAIIPLKLSARKFLQEWRDPINASQTGRTGLQSLK